MKTIIVCAALFAASSLAAAACDYGNASARAETSITVASIEAAKQSLSETTAPAKAEVKELKTEAAPARDPDKK